jgi:segregation and condensation protein A
LSVRETMSQLLRQLQARRYVEFQDLFEPHHSLALRVVSFIALLELARERLLEVTQAEAYAPLYLRLAFQSTPTPDLAPD